VTVQIGAQYDGDDFYCDVAIPNVAQLDVVHEDDRVLAFHHTRPLWDVHIVVVPKRHIASLTRASAADQDDISALLKVVQNVARVVEEERGAAAVLTNIGSYQESRHLHVHIHAGPRRDEPSFETRAER
jgi:histidine triad (HIT) family protein